MKAKKLLTCPIAGCNFIFSDGSLGWHTHVMRLTAHPDWHPELASVPKPQRREMLKELFKREHADWLMTSFSQRVKEKYDTSRPPPPPPYMPSPSYAPPPAYAAARDDWKSLIREVLTERTSTSSVNPGETVEHRQVTQSGEYVRAAIEAELRANLDKLAELEARLAKIA